MDLGCWYQLGCMYIQTHHHICICADLYCTRLSISAPITIIRYMSIHKQVKKFNEQMELVGKYLHIHVHGHIHLIYICVYTAYAQ